MAGNLEDIVRQARQLKAQGQLDAAIELYRRAAKAFPERAVVWHNLGASLGDAGHHHEALDALSRALQAGLKAAETHLAMARSHQQLGDWAEADAAYIAAIRQRPLLEAHHELAQLRWMRSGDLDVSLKELDRALSDHGPSPELLGIRARVMEFADEFEAAADVLHSALERWPDNLPLTLAAANVALARKDPSRAREHADNVLRQQPDSTSGATFLGLAQLAAGNAQQAEQTLLRLRRRLPRDQLVIAALATAWRLLDDDRYRQLYDYDALVRSYPLEAPSGWTHLGAYLAELTAALEARHACRTHPFGQSVRHGSQVANITRYEDPVLQAFPETLKGAVDAHIRHLGRGSDPLRSRCSDRWHIDGIWSVRLKADGFHVNHVHPDGWLSSACHIALPSSGFNGGREGWLQFGEPGTPTLPALGPEHFVEPKPGQLTLFPSYMWHGTVPFAADGDRLTIAFDLLPG